MGDMGEFWNDVKPEMIRASRQKRASNRQQGESALFMRGIPFLKKNGGAHLIVNPESPSKRVDYWPGTGLWRNYWGKPEGRGIKSLLAYLEADNA
jgi:hypothetical protein